MRKIALNEQVIRSRVSEGHASSAPDVASQAVLQLNAEIFVIARLYGPFIVIISYILYNSLNTSLAHDWPKSIT